MHDHPPSTTRAFIDARSPWQRVPSVVLLAALLGATQIGGCGGATEARLAERLDASGPLPSTPVDGAGGSDSASHDASPDPADSGARCAVADALGRLVDVVSVSELSFDKTFTEPPGPGVYELVEARISGSPLSSGRMRSVLRVEGGRWKRTDQLGDGPVIVSMANPATVAPFPDFAFFPVCGPWLDGWNPARFHTESTSEFDMYTSDGSTLRIERFARRQ